MIIAMGLVGVRHLAELEKAHLAAVDAIEPAHLFNAFPLVKEALAHSEKVAKRR
ncbi:MAG: hypothetical protein JO010_04265, partial [Alphaproteobacteria bacterium]|nr:hypothetical protein [Alphaproteobacteria bacterium]